MKKLISFILVLALLCLFLTPSFADFDLSYIRNNVDDYTINVDAEENLAFIETNISIPLKAFSHVYESKNRYSYTSFDILVINYFETSAYPILRLWIYYAADQFLNVNSVTFTVSGTEYTFSGISNSEYRVKDENGTMEGLLLIFGYENIDFILALAALIEAYSTKGIETLADPNNGMKVKMVLHGTRDVETVLGSGFALDSLFMIMNAFLYIDGYTYLDKAYATKMSVFTPTNTSVVNKPNKKVTSTPTVAPNGTKVAGAISPLSTNNTKPKPVVPQSRATQTPKPAEQYIMERGNYVFHRPSCSIAVTIPIENRIIFDSREDVLRYNYIPCWYCNP